MFKSKIRLAVVGIALLGATVLFAGCGTNLIENPKSNNGLYRAESDKKDTIVMIYDSNAKLDDGNEYANYSLWFTDDSEKNLFKDIHAYRRNRDMMMDKEGKIWSVGLAGKTQVGTFKQGEITITAADQIPKGIYKKTDEVVPAQDELLKSGQKLGQAKTDAMIKKYDNKKGTLF